MEPTSFSPDIQIVLNACWDDRVTFVREIIGVTKELCGYDIDPYQLEVLEALDAGERHITIKSGKGCGKSALLAWVGIHYLCCRPFPQGIATAGSKDQIYDVTWAAISKWHRHMRKTPIGKILADQLAWTKERFFLTGSQEESFITARTATKENPDSLRGLHAKYVIRMPDEASGIVDECHGSLEGNTGTLETIEILTSNPSRRSGHFYNTFHKEKELWRKFTWNAENSTIADKDLRERLLKRYGRDSSRYRVDVLGEFPLSDEETFISWESATAACEREFECNPSDPVVFGLDVAYSGDDTVLAIRQGHYFHPFEVVTRGANVTMSTVAHVLAAAKRWKPQMIFIDAIGYGQGVGDILQSYGLPVYMVNVTFRATDQLLYVALRDELWGRMKEWLLNGVGRLNDNADGDLVAQLTSPTSEFVEGVKTKIESKRHMKAVRHISSPDIADATNLCFTLPMTDFFEEYDEDEYEEAAPRRPLDPVAGY